MKFCMILGLLLCGFIAQTAASLEEFSPARQRLALTLKENSDLEQILFNSNDLLDSSSLEKLREILENLVDVLLPVAEGIVEEAGEVLEKALAKAREILANAEPILQKAIDDLIRILEVIIEERPVAVECLKKQRPALEALARDTADKLKKCGQQAIEQGKKAKQELQGEIDAVKASLVALKNLLAQCKNKDPAEAVRCVLRKSNEVRQLLAKLLDNVKTAVKSAAPKVSAIANSTIQCVEPVLKNVRAEGKTIVTNIKTCIGNNQAADEFFDNISLFEFSEFQAIALVSDNSALDKLRDLLEQLVAIGLPVLEEILDQADEILNKALEKAKQIVENAEPILKKAIDDVIRILVVINEEKPVLVKCLKDQHPVVKELARDSAAKLKVCGQKAIEEGKKAKTDIQAEIDSLKASVVALRDLLKQCKNDDPAEAVRCILQKSKEVREKISKIIDNVKQVVVAAAPKVQLVVQHAKECGRPVVINVKNQSQKIVKDVKTCVAKGYY